MRATPFQTRAMKKKIPKQCKRKPDILRKEECCRNALACNKYHQGSNWLVIRLQISEPPISITTDGDEGEDN